MSRIASTDVALTAAQMQRILSLRGKLRTNVPDEPPDPTELRSISTGCWLEVAGRDDASMHLVDYVLIMVS